MAEAAGRRKGLGFGAGALTGLAFSAAVLAGLSVSMPPEQPSGERPAGQTSSPGTPPGEPSAARSAPADVATQPASTSDAGPVREAPAASPPAAPEPMPAPAPAAPAGPEAPQPVPAQPEAPQPAAAQPSPPAGLSAATQGEAAATATSGPDAAQAQAEATPSPEPPPPVEPIWRANAASVAVPADVPLMAVVIDGATPASLPALRALAPFGPLTVALDPKAEGAIGFAEALRGLGNEVLVDLDAPPAGSPGEALREGVAALPMAVGAALGPVSDATARRMVLEDIARLQGLALDRVPAPAPGSALVTAGRAERMPVAGAALVITADTPATRAFQLLREAGLRAAREGSLVVVVEASPATLTAIGRWLAVPGEARPAPLTALVQRQGETRY